MVGVNKKCIVLSALYSIECKRRTGLCHTDSAMEIIGGIGRHLRSHFGPPHGKWVSTVQFYPFVDIVV
jgi:hypothetical protein